MVAGARGAGPDVPPAGGVERRPADGGGGAGSAGRRTPERGGGLADLAAALGYGGGGGTGAPVRGSAAGASDDARTLAIYTNSLGERHRTFASATELASENEWKDWPIRGPRTIGWVCRFINENGGTPMGRHSKWKSEARLQSEPGVAEHEAACKLLQTMMCYDQLDVGNLASAELLGRQIQMVEEKYKDRMQSGAGGTCRATRSFTWAPASRAGWCACAQPSRSTSRRNLPKSRAS